MDLGYFPEGLLIGQAIGYSIYCVFSHSVGDLINIRFEP